MPSGASSARSPAPATWSLAEIRREPRTSSQPELCTSGRLVNSPGPPGRGRTEMLPRAPSRALALAAICLAIAVLLASVIVVSQRGTATSPAPPARGQPYDAASQRVTATSPAPSATGQPDDAISYCLNGYGDAVPTMTVVGPEQRDQLQTLLDQKGAVQLGKGEYRGKLPQIILHSGQRIIGTPSRRGRDGSTLPTIVVAPGTTNAVVDGVDPDTLQFGSGSAIQRNCFARIHHCAGNGGFVSTGASLESNVVLDISDCLLRIDNRAGGYLMNNRFIRVKEQGWINQIDIRGDRSWASRGNVILWNNTLTPGGQGIYLQDQGDFSIVGLDAEAWNNGDQAPGGSLLRTGPMGQLRVMSVTGGDNTDHPTPIFDIGADELQAYNTGSIRTPASTKMRLQPTNRRSVVIDDQGSLSPVEDTARGAIRVHMSGAGSSTLSVSPAATSRQVAMQTMFGTPAITRPGQPWERPVFFPISDPVAANPRNPGRDDTSLIQNLIDTQGVAILPAGTYYISKSLVINHDHGLRGAGAGKTAIVAKSPSIDMIINDDHLGSGPGQSPQFGGKSFTFTLADLTLQGGRNGIHHDPYTAGGLAQADGIILSHVNFRDMTEAGIFVDNILGWDNNWLDFVNFYHNGTAIKERANLFQATSGSGDPPYEGYLDKNVFFHNQFVDNGIALDLQANRQSNDNAWVDSLFQDNKQALNQQGTVGTVMANSDFINNGGKGAVLQSDRPFSCVSCNFQA